MRSEKLDSAVAFGLTAVGVFLFAALLDVLLQPEPFRKFSVPGQDAPPPGPPGQKGSGNPQGGSGQVQ